MTAIRAEQFRGRPLLVRRWAKGIVDTALIVLVVIAAKTAIAEPYYVPSGSMEPTLQIGDELLATKFPYGYSSASLPIFVTLPDTPRILGALPHRGDVVVFRWPGDRSQIWVKRVIGLPGDRIAMRNGRLWINDQPVGLQPDGTGQDEAEDGSRRPVARYIETLPGGRTHTIFKHSTIGPFDNTPEVVVPPDHCSSWATIATTRPTAGFRSTWAGSASCRFLISSDGSTLWSDRGIWGSRAGRSGLGRPACGCRGSSLVCSESDRSGGGDHQPRNRSSSDKLGLHQG